MIMSIDAKKTFDNIQHGVLVETSKPTVKSLHNLEVQEN